MGKLKNKLIYSALGVSSGLSGLISFSHCSGNSCTSCWGCAGMGASVVILALMGKRRKNPEKRQIED